MSTIEGYLEKKSGMSKWKKKWCWVTQGKLFIANHPQGSSAQIVLNSVVVQDATQVTGKTHALSLMNVSGKTLFLKCNDSEEYEQWKSALTPVANTIFRRSVSKSKLINSPETTHHTPNTTNPSHSNVKESEFTMFEDIVEACVVCKTKDGKIRMYNNAAEELFKFPNEEVLGKKIYCLLSNKMSKDSAFLKKVKSGKNRIIGRGKVKSGQHFKTEILISHLSGGNFVAKFKSLAGNDEKENIRDLAIKLKKLEEEMKSLKTENSILREEVGAREESSDEEANLYFSKDPTQLFSLKEIIGKGAFGAVFRAKELKTKNEVAIKILSEQIDFDTLKNEIQALKQVDSPYVVKYYGTFLKDKQNWLVMEYSNAGSLADMLDRMEGNFNEKQLVLILLKVLSGIRYLHKIGRIHRDIKAANVLVATNGDCKLTDFGISAQLFSADAVRNTSIGSPYWMAPEIIEEKGHNNKVDIWSLGITCIELAEKKPPHSEKTPIRALFAITTSPPPRLTKAELYSSLLIEFIELCLNKEPKERPSAEDLLNHKLFAKENLAKDSVLTNLFERYPIDLKACENKYGSFSGHWHNQQSGEKGGSNQKKKEKPKKEKVEEERVVLKGSDSGPKEKPSTHVTDGANKETNHHNQMDGEQKSKQKQHRDKKKRKKVAPLN
eukprot:TRINITY_DN6417_c0_g1_i3.p1 TRINITY_DN6417_c0_g1~~TRINITY_DN6417_c0_g1_i3.p1  ORF type:complete len:665 (-),score=144.11 TRINITY_DN6417_c0_g1_i3:57-2051(-)